MLKAIQIAEFFLSLDDSKELFNKNLIERNGRTFYEGNARLNKYLHLAQNIFIAKTGAPLIEDSFYAYDNGGIVPSVQENYAVLLSRNTQHNDIPEDVKDFLLRFYIAFQNASIDELIELSHEDSEWEKKHAFYRKQDQKMDSLAHIDEYRKQYADIVTVLDRMAI